MFRSFHSLYQMVRPKNLPLLPVVANYKFPIHSRFGIFSVPHASLSLLSVVTTYIGFA